MKVLKAIQQEGLSDAVQAKFSMAIPVLDAMLGSLARNRAKRFGGYAAVTLADLARETREGAGDAGICFELAVHQAIEKRSQLIHPLVSEVLDRHMGIKEDADSILFWAREEPRHPNPRVYPKCFDRGVQSLGRKPWAATQTETLHSANHKCISPQ